MIPLLEWASRFLEQLTPSPAWSDRRLIRACLRGRDEAWEALVHKYKRLVFALVLEHGFSEDEAAELFQETWVEVLRSLERLSTARSIRHWLVERVSERCTRRRSGVRSGDAAAWSGASAADPQRIRALERQQRMREILTRLGPRCRELIRLLFYFEPPLANEEIASRLELSSRRFERVRRRCLGRLQRALGEPAG